MRHVVVLVLFVFGTVVFGSPQRTLREIPLPSSTEEEVVIPYNYGYEIRDPDSYNFQNKAEMMDESGNVFGSYSVLMPDGNIYTTSYTVMKGGGYVANVRKVPAVFRRRKRLHTSGETS